MNVIAFDVFGTLVDASPTMREDRQAYAEHVATRGSRPGQRWAPLSLPDSWKALKVFPDVYEGLAKLREAGYVCVTCSNLPVALQVEIFARNKVAIDFIVPLEMCWIYKTHPRAYESICQLLSCRAGDVTFVTANKEFGDIEAAGKLGMHTCLIRGDDVPTLTDLAYKVSYETHQL